MQADLKNAQADLNLHFVHMSERTFSDVTGHNTFGEKLLSSQNIK